MGRLRHPEEAREAVDRDLERVNALFAGRVDDFRRRVEASDLALFPERGPVEVEEP